MKKTYIRVFGIDKGKSSYLFTHNMVQWRPNTFFHIGTGEIYRLLDNKTKLEKTRQDKHIEVF